MDIDVETPETSYELCVSDVLTDCVADLLQAAIRLHQGNNAVQIFFWGEPSTDTWHIVCDDGTLHIKHYYSDETILDRFLVPERRLGQLKDHCTTNLYHFSEEIIRFVNQISETIDRDVYESHEGWDHPFPTEKLVLLNKLRRKK